jgi:hypothetical protein
MMGVATPPGSDTVISNKGLPFGHAYSLLAVKSFPKVAGGLRLVKIRNPWGNSTEWNGDWCDNDPRWANPGSEFAEVVKVCSATRGADGTFWMTWNDMVANFEQLYVCLDESSWTDYRIAGTFTKHGSTAGGGVPSVVLEIWNETDKPITTTLMLSQRDRRGAAAGSLDATYDHRLLLVSQADPTNPSAKQKTIQITNGTWGGAAPSRWTYTNSRDLAMRFTFAPSKYPYLVIPKQYMAKDKSYVLGVISDTTFDGVKARMNFKSLSPANDVVSRLGCAGFPYNAAASAAGSSAGTAVSADVQKKLPNALPTTQTLSSAL